MNGKTSKVLNWVAKVLRINPRRLKKNFNKLPHNLKHQNLVGLAHKAKLKLDNK